MKKASTNQLRITRLASLALFSLSLTTCTSLQTGNTQHTHSIGQFAFATRVKPLFEHRCSQCHNDRKSLSGLNLQDREATLDPSRGFIIPGKPNSSRLYTAVTRPNAHPTVMPADGWGLTETERKSLEVWISEGAPWPTGRSGRIKKRDYRIEKEDYL